ncbi:MAG TPA: hypothetical protein VGE98_02355 [Thermoanaerobaculia bacterium]
MLLSALAAMVLLTGCFEVEQAIHLEKDRSGTASFAMTVNFEAIAEMVAQMQHSMSGKTGNATPEEIADAKKQFLAQRKEEQKQDDFTAKRAEWEKSLPKGVRLLDANVDDKGMKLVLHFRLAFDDVAKLAQLEMPGDKPGDKAGGEGGAGGGGMPGSKNPFDRPFGGLRVVDEGKTILVTSDRVNPMKDDKMPDMSGGGPDQKEMAKQVEQIMKGFKVTFKVDAPMQVAETNATRRDGNTLYWEYNLDTFKDEAKRKQAEQGIRVRFRK